MFSDVDDVDVRWFLEATTLVGAMSIQYPNGEKVTIDADGSMWREAKPIEIDWCDKCERWQEMDFGRYEKTDSIRILWYCQECK